jgi:predicted nucleic acid-binding protein
MIVVDNNVICGFILRTDDFHAQAVAARKTDPDWHAPALFRSEFRSVVRKLLVQGESEDALIQAAQAAVMSVTIHQSNDAEVFSVIREEIKTSAYDAEYVALARRLGCKLLTTDEGILKCFPQLAVSLASFTFS